MVVMATACSSRSPRTHATSIAPPTSTLPHSSSSASLIALDATTGHLRWTAPLPFRAVDGSATTIGGRTIVAEGFGGPASSGLANGGSYCDFAHGKYVVF